MIHRNTDLQLKKQEVGLQICFIHLQITPVSESRTKQFQFSTPMKLLIL
jgi:hypothetical protein